MRRKVSSEEFIWFSQPVNEQQKERANAKTTMLKKTLRVFGTEATHGWKQKQGRRRRRRD